jgi:hypothetical protein
VSLTSSYKRLSYTLKIKLINSGHYRYAWAAQPGSHWAVVVASGIPFGIGAFVLFVSTLLYPVEIKGFSPCCYSYPQSYTLLNRMGLKLLLLVRQI